MYIFKPNSLHKMHIQGDVFLIKFVNVYPFILKVSISFVISNETCYFGYIFGFSVKLQDKFTEN